MGCRGGRGGSEGFRGCGSSKESCSGVNDGGCGGGCCGGDCSGNKAGCCLKNNKRKKIISINSKVKTGNRITFGWCLCCGGNEDDLSSPFTTHSSLPVSITTQSSRNMHHQAHPPLVITKGRIYRIRPLVVDEADGYKYNKNPENIVIPQNYEHFE